ncbi:MAG: HAMP domain-containing sensor histidine kinase [Myxococcota bacterium]|jgi:signal transduction histidine kinase|nr:HAMP domain-containing sensor histidine kinase [Myxococcota bacterium]
MFGSLRKSWRARLLEIRSSDPQVQRRGRALITIYLVCAGLTLAYLPYILMMPLYEGRRLPYLLVLAVIEAFLAFNIWLSKQGKVDASIVSNCAVMVLGPTILYLGLKIIMSTMWLMVVMPLLCAFAIERKQAILIAAISIGSVMLGRFYLAPYVSPLETLERETIMMLFAAMGIAVTTYLSASTYKTIAATLDRNHREAEMAKEQALEQVKRIEQEYELVQRANEEKTAFFAEMSHELRTPLNAILGYSELLLEDLQEFEQLPEEILEDTRCIQQASRHLLSLLHDMLDLEEIGRELDDMEPERFDIVAFCREMAASMQVVARNHEDILLVEAMLPDPEVVHDLTWMRQILFNLLSNAIKFTEAGTITIALAAIEPDQVAIEVRDTGIGMNEREVARVFEEFVQAQEHTSREFGGTGLGLPLCLRLADRMGGELVIESAVGEGTTARIVLPRVALEKEKAEVLS